MKVELDANRMGNEIVTMVNTTSMKIFVEVCFSRKTFGKRSNQLRPFWAKL